MYVRNYSSRYQQSAKVADGTVRGLSVGAQDAALPSLRSDGGADAVSRGDLVSAQGAASQSVSDLAEGALTDPATDEEVCAEDGEAPDCCDGDTVAATPFGSSGIPRQPLRRRKLPRERRVSVGNRDGVGECPTERFREGDISLPHEVESVLECIPDPPYPRREELRRGGVPAVGATEPVAPEERRVGCGEGVRAAERSRCGDTDRREERGTSPLIRDHILLGALLLLFLSEGAADDIILILGLLLCKG